MTQINVFCVPSPLVTGGIAVACLVLFACTPAIGDHCALSSDCSIQGNRTCDTSQPGGYCTIFGCSANSCPDNAACVVYGAGVPGCPYDDYQAPSRTGRAMCLKTCGSDSDCRQGDGYYCAPLPQPPWKVGPPWTTVLDNRTSTRVCTVAPRSTDGAAAPPPTNSDICSSSRPMASSLDAMVTLSDAPPDTSDVTAPESDAITDGGSAEAADASQEATADSGAFDAPGG
jgi:hypothetical protein